MKSEVKIHAYLNFIGRLIGEVDQIIENFKSSKLEAIESQFEYDRLTIHHELSCNKNGEWVIRSYAYRFDLHNQTEKREIETPVSFSEPVAFLPVPIWVTTSCDCGGYYTGASGSHCFSSDKQLFIDAFLASIK